MSAKSMTSIRTASAVCLVMGLTSPGLLQAAPTKSKVIVALVAGAQREFDAGNFERAADLFLEIYRQDTTQIAALYNAARANHLGGRWQRAEDLYAELLATGKIDEATTAKVKGFVQDVHGKRAEQKADEAKKAEGAGQFSAAAERWAEARQLLLARLDWLLRQARAEQLAGHKDVALSLFDQYLAGAPADAAERVDAVRWRAELVPPTPAPPVVRSSRPEVTIPAVSAGKATPILAYSVMGAGALALVAGGAILAVAKADDDALQGKFKKTNSVGYIDGTTYSAAAAEVSRIEGQYTLGWALTGIGAVGAGVGTWLWLRGNESKIAVLPVGDGLQLVGRF